MDDWTAAMDHVIASDQHIRTVVFYQQALTTSMTYRLAFAQQVAANRQAIERELPNLLETAWQSYAQRAWKLVIGFCEVLQPVLDLRGSWRESLVLLDWAREAALKLQDRQRAARYLHDRADILNQQGRSHEAEQLYHASEQQYRALGDDEQAIKSRHMRSMVVRAQGHLREAETLSLSTIAEARQLGLTHWLAHPLYVRGLLARDRNDLRGARQAVEESVALLDDTDELAMTAQCRHFLGELALLEGDCATARAELETSLQISRRIGIIRRVAATQRLLGDLARIEGHDAAAEQAYHEALGLATQAGDQPQLARLLLSQSQLTLRRGRLLEAIDLLRGAAATYEHMGDTRGVAVVSMLLALLYLRQRRFGQAVRMALKVIGTAWKTRLIRPRILLGMLRRRRGL